ncbi:hypothetical protein DPMN_026430 [Dreissena polymorpha]|uniref:Uncharacterized protein n=1 Tax=Dreissena polymorpha TaxID=45954 RepID=A0A9D4LV60_DREPO|nr:hypothetical protein DPMN_026430 [Dreissena polymorpha]
MLTPEIPILAQERYTQDDKAQSKAPQESKANQSMGKLLALPKTLQESIQKSRNVNV